jgi:hypothetical protein
MTGHTGRTGKRGSTVLQLFLILLRRVYITAHHDECIWLGAPDHRKTAPTDESFQKQVGDARKEWTKTFQEEYDHIPAVVKSITMAMSTEDISAILPTGNPPHQRPHIIRVGERSIPPSYVQKR